MQGELPKVVSLKSESSTADAYDNHIIAEVNDHAVHISVMTRPYHWHVHPDSDETFLCIEGRLAIDFEAGTVELEPGNLLTVPRGVRHRTRPIGDRTVNLTFESAAATSVSV